MAVIELGDVITYDDGSTTDAEIENYGETEDGKRIDAEELFRSIHEAEAYHSLVMPALYQPTIRRTVTPVPAIFGRPPRIAGSRSISVPISTLDAMAPSAYRGIS